MKTEGQLFFQLRISDFGRSAIAYRLNGLPCGWDRSNFAGIAFRDFWSEWSLQRQVPICVDRDVVDDVLLRVGPLMAFELCLDVSV